MPRTRKRYRAQAPVDPAGQLSQFGARSRKPSPTSESPPRDAVAPIRGARMIPAWRSSDPLTLFGDASQDVRAAPPASSPPQAPRFIPPSATARAKVRRGRSRSPIRRRPARSVTSDRSEASGGRTARLDARVQPTGSLPACAAWTSDQIAFLCRTLNLLTEAVPRRAPGEWLTCKQALHLLPPNFAEGDIIDAISLLGAYSPLHFRLSVVRGSWLIANAP
jgi:hypothetical protein